MTKLDKHADAIRTLFGVTDNGDGARERRIIRNEAMATCRHCAECASPLAPGAPIWREHHSYGRSFLGGCHYRVVPVCERCKSKWRFFLPPQPCEGCGRPVHQEDNYRYRWRVACCENCARKANAATARRKRSEARGTRQCAKCGETFEPTRTDARFCSSRCRQRAYRDRTETPR